MSHRDEDGVVWIADEADSKCALCGTVTETRPYGPGGAEVCHPCATQDEARTEAWMGHKLFGEPLPEPYASEPKASADVA